MVGTGVPLRAEEQQSALVSVSVLVSVSDSVWSEFESVSVSVFVSVCQFMTICRRRRYLEFSLSD